MTSPQIQDAVFSLSIVMPVYNETGNIRALYSGIKDMLKKCGENGELIFIDDGSTDGSPDILKSLAGIDKSVRFFRFGSNKGQCKALEKGFAEAQSEIIVKMDSDMQGDPMDIPILIAKLKDGFDVVCGWRTHRHDPWYKIVKSIIGNHVQRSITKIELHDLGSPVQVYRKNVVKNVHFQNKYDVFCIPLILSKYTKKITEVKIRHHPRRYGRSKYSLLKTCLGVTGNYIRLACAMLKSDKAMSRSG